MRSINLQGCTKVVKYHYSKHPRMEHVQIVDGNQFQSNPTLQWAFLVLQGLQWF